MNSIKKSVILLGAGGHAKVLASLLKLIHVHIAGVCAPGLDKQMNGLWRGICVLDEELVLNEYLVNDILMVNGIGQQQLREKIFDKFKNRGYCFPQLIHPQAWVDSTAKLDEGAQVMAGVIIQADTFIGKNAIINTRATIDHDCYIGNHVHIAPGAVLCGSVNIEHQAFIGSGAILAQGIRIGEGACIGAGTSIVRNVIPNQKIIPAAVRQYINS